MSSIYIAVLLLLGTRSCEGKTNLKDALLDPFNGALYNAGGPLCRDLFPSELREDCWSGNVCGHHDEWRKHAYAAHEPIPQIENRSKHQNSHYSWANQKIVISVGHNGFGNQLFQHFFAYSIARHMRAKLYFISYDKMEGMAAWGAPNTGTGRDIMDWLNDDDMKWELLPEDHPDKLACRAGNLSYMMRPVDHRSRKNVSGWKSQIADFIDPYGKTKCIITVGYWIDRNPCAADAKKLWYRLYNPWAYFPPLKMMMSPEDMIMHLRCVTGHGSYSSHGKCQLHLVHPFNHCLL